MKKIVKPHKARKPSASTDVPSFARGKDQILKSPARLQRRKKNELGEFDDGKDNFKNIKEAYDYVNRNGLNNALIAVGDGNIPMDQREYQITLPNVTVTPQKYDSSFDGSLQNTLNTLNAMTGGIMNRFSPTQNIRALYDTYQLLNGNISRTDWQNNLIYGNNGIVTDNFYNNHPITSTIINGLVDGVNLRNLHSYNKLIGFGNNPLKSEWNRAVIHNTKRPVNYNFRELLAYPIVAQYSLLKGEMPDINNPWYTSVLKKLGMENAGLSRFGIDNAIEYRMNAWKKYLGLKQTDNYNFIPTDRGTYTSSINDMNEDLMNDVLRFGDSRKMVAPDYITSSGGNVFHDFERIPNDINGNQRGIVRIKDTWDLMPGQKLNKRISNKIKSIISKPGSELYRKANQVRNYANKIGKRDWESDGIVYIGNPIQKGVARTLNKIANKLDSAYDFDWMNTKLAKWLQNTEFGKFIGAEPFDITYEFPVTKIDDKWHVGLNAVPTPLEQRIYHFNKMNKKTNEKYNNGKDSGIHIKKANRGKFTAAAKRAGMGVQAYARKILKAPKGKYSSTLRKRANFAANAAKWH